MTMKKDATVRDVMRKNVTFVDGRCDVMEAMRIMKRVGATSLFVEKRNESDEYGMVLFSDIAREVIGKDRAPERVNVYEIMAKPVISVRPEMRIPRSFRAGSYRQLNSKRWRWRSWMSGAP